MPYKKKTKKKRFHKGFLKNCKSTGLASHLLYKKKSYQRIRISLVWPSKARVSILMIGVYCFYLGRFIKKISYQLSKELSIKMIAQLF